MVDTPKADHWIDHNVATQILSVPVKFNADTDSTIILVRDNWRPFSPSSNPKDTDLAIARLQKELRIDLWMSTSIRFDKQQWHTARVHLGNTRFKAVAASPIREKAICQALLLFVEWIDEVAAKTNLLSY